MLLPVATRAPIQLAIDHSCPFHVSSIDSVYASSDIPFYVVRGEGLHHCPQFSIRSRILGPLFGGTRTGVIFAGTERGPSVDGPTLFELVSGPM